MSAAASARAARAACRAPSSAAAAQPADYFAIENK